MMWSVGILAGGKSSRMGRDKSFVELAGQAVIEHVIERVTNLGQQETFVITNRPTAYRHLGLVMVSDLVPEKGSLGGIYTAITHSPTDWVLVVACDMPFLSSTLLQHMVSLIQESSFDVIVPRVEGHPQGLHALYHKRCLDPIREQIEQDRLKVIGYYDQVRVRYLDESEYQGYDPEGWAFFNLNSPADLADARRVAKNSRPL
ncbi:MAG: molybdenum cofactor guanylyltransferase [Chloroflexi bacterium]|nr:molybdenum cofactor guanylyltransferase [Chloroflexota bacterium]